jgi:hypothetical protein
MTDSASSKNGDGDHDVRFDRFENATTWWSNFSLGS